jgi:hypothetical protein
MIIWILKTNVSNKFNSGVNTPDLMIGNASRTFKYNSFTLSALYANVKNKIYVKALISGMNLKNSYGKIHEVAINSWI